MTDAEALQVAERMRPLHRSVILLCSRRTSIGYGRVAEKLGLSYDEVQAVGHWLQRKKFGFVDPVRHGSEFAGSRIFLNELGEHVRLAADILNRTRGANV